MWITILLVLRVLYLVPSMEINTDLLNLTLEMNKQVAVYSCSNTGKLQLSLEDILKYIAKRASSIFPLYTQKCFAENIILAKEFMKRYGFWVSSSLHAQAKNTVKFSATSNCSALGNKYYKNLRDGFVELNAVKLSSKTIIQQVNFESRKDLSNIFLRAGVVTINTPADNLHERLTSEKDKHLDSLAKFNYALFLHLRDVHNFTYDLHVAHSWGYMTKAGVFDGLIGMLQRDEIDVGATSALIKPTRLNVVDFAGHTWKFWPCFLFLHPSGKGMITALLTPLSLSVWICSITMFLMVVFMLKLSESLLGSDFLRAWSNSLVVAAGAFTLQGTGRSSPLASWRLSILASLLWALLVNAHYSASLVSSLILPAPRSLRTLADLVNSPFAVAFENVSYNKEFVARTTDKLGRQLIRKKKPVFLKLADGVDQMKKGYFAFHTEGGAVYRLAAITFTEQQKCALSYIAMFPPEVMSMPVQKGSPLRELFARSLLLVAEGGLKARQEKVWRASRPACTTSDDLRPVELTSVLPASFVVASGLFLSLITLAAEIICKRCTKRTINYWDSSNYKNMRPTSGKFRIMV